jgi:hypothetical protein
VSGVLDRLRGRPSEPEPPHVAERRERRETETKQALVEPVRYGWVVKLDVSKLTADECEELRALYRESGSVGPDATLGLLDERQRKRVRELLDRGLPDAVRERLAKVEARRAEAELQRLATAAVAEGVPPRLRPGVAPGETLLPAEAFALGMLHVGDLGLLALVLHAWTSGDASVFRGGRFSDDGSALVLPKKVEPRVREWNQDYSMDGAGRRVIDFAGTFDHLTRNGFLDAKRDTRGWTIRLGGRLRGWSP